MKAIMYHYVRPETPNLPHLKYLHREDFVQQLDHVERTYGFVPKDRFLEGLATGSPAPGVVLTFDDGFADHRDHVAPILADRGLWGIFYVPTGPLVEARLLDVHRVHVILGALGGRDSLRMLHELLDSSMIDRERRGRFEQVTYQRQMNDMATLSFKRSLNYYLDPAEREPILRGLVESALGGESEAGFVEKFYLRPDDLIGLETAGHIIGSHTVRHLVMSNLPPDAQCREIRESFAHLAYTVGHDIDTFAYPYGGPTTFTAETQAELDRVGCEYAFAVNPADIERTDLLERRQALPRYDCNAFPFGQVRPL